MAAKKVLQYLKKTLTYGLTFRREDGLQLEGHCDADFGACPDTSRSTTGFSFNYGGAVVSWCSKRQPTVALSSCESEYMAGNMAAREAIWIRDFLAELGWAQSTTNILSDSQSAMALMKNSVHHPRTKHIRRQWHYVRDLIAEGEVKFSFIGTNLQVADALTKAVPQEKLMFCREGMGVHDTSIYFPVTQ